MNPRETGNRSPDDRLEDSMGALFDPIVYDKHAKGYEDEVPKWLKPIIIEERLAENLRSMNENREPTGTDAEAFAYLITYTIGSPVDLATLNVYKYLYYKYIGPRVRNFPEFAMITKLSNKELDVLYNLKKAIWKSKVRVREAWLEGEKPPSNYEGRWPEPPPVGKMRSTLRKSSKTRQPWLPSGVKMHQVPLNQFIKWQVARYHKNEPDSPAKEKEVQDWMNMHERAVANAVSSGISVSKEVKADYE